MAVRETTRRTIIETGRHSGGEPFDAFYRREYHHVVSMARALVSSQVMAEDLAQEAFIAAHKNWERISTYDEPRAWVRRVMINRGTSWHRRLSTELRTMARLAPDTEAHAPDLSPETTGIWREVARLPRRQRQSIVLHYVGQLSVEEIGETLECSPGAVKTHLHRGRQALEGRLEDWRYET